MKPAPGTTRNTRLLHALHPRAAMVDTRTERALLAQLAPTARLFNFFDENDRPCGRWDDFFTHVPMVRYALLSEINLGRQTAILRASLLKLGLKINPEDTSHRSAAWTVIHLLRTLHQRIDDNARIFAGWPQQAGFASLLDNAIGSVLAADHRTVNQCARWLAAHYPPPPLDAGPADEEPETPAQNPPPELKDARWKQSAPDTHSIESPESFVRRLTQATWSTHATVAQLVQEAQSRFAKLSANPMDLEPHFGLYLAFVRQFTGAQQAINELPERHRDFFYRDVLQLAPAGPVPDTTFVAFTAVPQGWTELPRGTPLLAGKDAAGQPILYRTQQPVAVTDSTVARLATSYLADTWQPGLPGFYHAPNAALTDELGAPLSTGTSWATFGEQPVPPAPAVASPAGLLDAQLGFAINSPVLHLEEGQRTLTLTFVFNPATPVAQTSLSLTAAQLPFVIDYSGAKAWVPVSAAQITCTFTYTGAPPATVTPNELTLVITLDAGAAACVNYVPKTLDPAAGPAGAGFDPRSPVLRVRYANPLAAFCGWDRSIPDAIASAFASAPLTQLKIDVAATGLRDLVLAGPTGQFAPGKPFPPFGSPPLASATFAVGKVEVFRKPLTTLSLHLGWQGLPENPVLCPNGLQDYYADYLVAVANPPPQMFRNDQYGAHFSGLSKRTWQPLDLASPTPATPQNAGPLFWWQKDATAPVVPPVPPAAPATPDGVLAATQSWTALPGQLATLTPEPALAAPLVYTPAATTGFVGLTLVAPDYLFGQQLYPSAVATVALDNAMAVVAVTRKDKNKPAPDADSPSAYVLLRVPATQSLVTRAIHFVLRSTKTTWTFNTALFPAVLKAGAFPADVAALIIAAGAVPATAFAAIPNLEKKPFTDLASFNTTVTTTLGLATATPPPKPATDARNAITYWLAQLLYPTPPPSPIGVKPMPAPPLVPTIADISLDYSATTTIDPLNAASAYPPWDTLWQITPQATFRRPAGASPLLSAVEAGGYLHIGLSNVEPPETLALLFIMESVPASAFATLAADPPTWAVLAGDTWLPLQSAVHDGTYGFLRTGIVRLDLPEAADTTHTTMPNGLVWVRAHVSHPAAHLRTLQVLPHAVEVAWSPSDAATPADLVAASAQHFAQLPAPGAITGLQVPDPAVQKVLQPLAASGGSPAETNEDFALRVSERLRHKGRAVAPPDYERILLRQFPSVFFARAVAPATRADAGTVTLVVLPTVMSPPNIVPPGFVPGDLLALQAAITACAPLSAQVVVTNPLYEAIRLSVSVQFSSDRSFAFHCTQLTADLKAFISPWIYTQATVTEPVRSFHLSDFTLFMRGLAYVRQVGRCQLFKADDLQQPLESVQPVSPLALLISADTHDITLLT